MSKGIKELILISNSEERVKVQWDGERFAIIKTFPPHNFNTHVTILNPKEMMELIKFGSTCGEGY